MVEQHAKEEHSIVRFTTTIAKRALALSQAMPAVLALADHLGFAKHAMRVNFVQPRTGGTILG